MSVYRILQEALTNTVRHGKAQRARVRLSWEPDALEIEAADDGICHRCCLVGPATAWLAFASASRYTKGLLS